MQKINKVIIINNRVREKLFLKDRIKLSFSGKNITRGDDNE